MRCHAGFQSFFITEKITKQTATHPNTKQTDIRKIKQEKIFLLIFFIPLPQLRNKSSVLKGHTSINVSVLRYYFAQENHQFSAMQSDRQQTLAL